jgi:HD-GYP domain-containing protein (c-di-GMP phosphodiesterase class II)
MLKAHPVVAAQVLGDVPSLAKVVPLVYHHHEWYDGHGYVTGLAGEDIPTGSRLLAVADAFVAMTSDRPYRRAMTVETALSELYAKAGTQFDPAAVEGLRAVLEEHPDLATVASRD